MLKTENNNLNYIDKARDIIERVCEDGESIGIVLQHTKTFSFEALQRFAKELFPNKGYCEIFTSKVIDYFYDRLNSYTDSCEPENISQMLTMSEIRFIVGSEEFQTILSGKKCDIEKIFAHRVAGAYKKHADAEMHKAHVQRVNAVVDELSKYDRKFKSNEYFRSKTYVTSESGEMVEVTREMVDMAYQYAHSQKLHTSNNVMRSLINAVVNGKINNQPETERDMREMRNQAINEIYSLDELFATIDRVK